MRMIALVVAVLMSALSADADEITSEQKKHAVELYRSGVIHYQSGDLEQAAREFKESFQTYPKPETLFNLAQTHRLLKHYEDAVFFYKQFLASGQVREADRTQIEKRIAELEDIMKEQQHAQTAPPQGPELPSAAASGPPSTQPSPALAVTAAPLKQKKPMYKRAWFWVAVVGGAAVVAVGVGLGVGLSHSSPYPSVNPTDGTFQF